MMEAPHVKFISGDLTTLSGAPGLSVSRRQTAAQTGSNPPPTLHRYTQIRPVRAPMLFFLVFPLKVALLDVFNTSHICTQPASCALDGTRNTKWRDWRTFYLHCSQSCSVLLVFVFA